MKRFRFQIQAIQNVTVEADTAEEARKKIINWHTEEIGEVTLVQAIEEFNLPIDAYVTNGVEVDENGNRIATGEIKKHVKKYFDEKGAANV